jgi:low affinity Fe/Cu permease
MFSKFSKSVAQISAQPATFCLAVFIVLAWGISGPLFHYSDTWQLVINTGTSLVTFLMVFLIQNTQNHDSVAIQLKLDELIRSAEGAQNRMISLEDSTEEELETLRKVYARFAGNHKKEAKN